MAVIHEFQALTLSEAQEEIQAYEARSYKSIQGQGWPKATKLPSRALVKVPIGLEYSPGEFQQRRRKNQLSDSYGDHHDQIPRWVTLDENNSTSGQQLPQRQMWNFPQRQDADQSGYYPEDSELDTASLTLVSASEASITREGQNLEPEGTFDHCLNRKIMLSKLNDDSSTNYLWIWLADAYQYVNSVCLLSAPDNEID